MVGSIDEHKHTTINKRSRVWKTMSYKIMGLLRLLEDLDCASAVRPYGDQCAQAMQNPLLGLLRDAVR